MVRMLSTIVAEGAGTTHRSFRKKKGVVTNQEEMIRKGIATMSQWLCEVALKMKGACYRKRQAQLVQDTLFLRIGGWRSIARSSGDTESHQLKWANIKNQCEKADFQFGRGEGRTATSNVLIPAEARENFARAQVHDVAGSFPLLVGLRTSQKVHVTIRLEDVAEIGC